MSDPVFDPDSPLVLEILQLCLDDSADGVENSQMIADAGGYELVSSLAISCAQVCAVICEASVPPSMFASAIQAGIVMSERARRIREETDAWLKPLKENNGYGHDR